MRSNPTGAPCASSAIPPARSARRADGLQQFAWLLDRVAAAFHAGAVGAVEGVHRALLLLLRGLLLSALVLARARAAGHYADRGTGASTVATVNDGAYRSASDRTPRTLAAADC